MREFSVYVFKYVVAAVVGWHVWELMDNPYMRASRRWRSDVTST